MSEHEENLRIAAALGAAATAGLALIGAAEGVQAAAGQPPIPATLTIAWQMLQHAIPLLPTIAPAIMLAYTDRK